MKKLSEIKLIRVTVIFLSVLQVVSSAWAADSIQMINNQPVAVVSVDVALQTNANQPISPTPEVDSFESGPLTPARGMAPPEVPAGWTRAASNANFAFKKNESATCSLPQCKVVDFYVKNLITGQEVLLEKLIGRDAYVSRQDADSDGNVFYVYHSNPSSARLQTYNFLTGERNENASTFYYQYETMGLVDGLIKVTYPKFMGYPDRYFSPKTAQEVIPLPAGWTRAASNANFAFQKTTNAGITKLSLLNLTTGASRTLAEVDSSSGLSISDIYDVSPDGQHIVYGTSRLSYGAQMVVERAGSAEGRLELQGEIGAITFGAGRVTVKTKTADIRQAYEVDLNQLRVQDTYYQLATPVSNSNVRYDLKTKTVGEIYVRGLGNASHDVKAIRIYDAGRGTDRMRLVGDYELLGTVGGNFNVSFYQIDNSSGQRILSVSMTAPGHLGGTERVSQVVNVETGKNIPISGEINSIKKVGALTRYDIKEGSAPRIVYPDSKAHVYVNLSVMTTVLTINGVQSVSSIGHFIDYIVKDTATSKSRHVYVDLEKKVEVKNMSPTMFNHIKICNSSPSCNIAYDAKGTSIVKVAILVFWRLWADLLFDPNTGAMISARWRR